MTHRENKGGFTDPDASNPCKKCGAPSECFVSYNAPNGWTGPDFYCEAHHPWKVRGERYERNEASLRCLIP